MEYVVLVVFTLIAGLAVGFARGGRFRASAMRVPKRVRLLITALGLYTLGVLGSWVWAPLLPTFSALCGFTLAYFAWVNRDLTGARLVALGFAANATVLLINGAVPVSESAAGRAGITDVTNATDGMHVPAADATLSWLGEVIPVAFPLMPQVASPGDIAIAAGLALAVVSAMTPTVTSRATQQTRARVSG